MGGAIDSDGGVLAPSLYAQRLLTSDLERSIIRPHAQFVNITSKSITIPSVDVTLGCIIWPERGGTSEKDHLPTDSWWV